MWEKTEEPKLPPIAIIYIRAYNESFCPYSQSIVIVMLHHNPFILFMT